MTTNDQINSASFVVYHERVYPNPFPYDFLNTRGNSANAPPPKWDFAKTFRPTCLWPLNLGGE